MEMPEGWNKFYQLLKRHPHKPFIFDMDHTNQMIVAFDLMKEMAEALEFIRKSELENGTVGRYLGAWQRLKDFKEWK